MEPAITTKKMTDFMDKNEDAILHDDSIDKGNLNASSLFSDIIKYLKL